MAVDCFLELKGIEGESTRKGYEKKIPVLSYSWGCSNPSTIGVTGGGGGGKASLSDLSIMKKADSSSPLLFLNCAAGTHYDTAKLTLLKSGGVGAELDFIVYELENIFISSVQYSGAGDDTPMESVSLSFAKLTYTYTPQKKDGTKGTPVVGSWDITKVSDK